MGLIVSLCFTVFLVREREEEQNGASLLMKWDKYRRCTGGSCLVEGGESKYCTICSTVMFHCVVFK